MLPQRWGFDLGMLTPLRWTHIQSSCPNGRPYPGVQHLQAGRSALVTPKSEAQHPLSRAARVLWMWAFPLGVCRIQYYGANDMYTPNGKRRRQDPLVCWNVPPASQGATSPFGSVDVPQHCNMSLTAASFVSKYRVTMRMVREPSRMSGSVWVAAYNV